MSPVPVVATVVGVDDVVAGKDDLALDVVARRRDVLGYRRAGVASGVDGVDTTGDGTGDLSETVYASGALYLPLEAVDNSDAPAGEQTRVEVVRVA